MAISRSDALARFATSLKRLRLGRGMTLAQFARYAGVYREQLAGWEGGKNCPQWWMVLRLADRFNLPVDYFYFGDEEGKNGGTGEQ